MSERPICLECGDDLQIEGAVERGEIVICPACGAEHQAGLTGGGKGQAPSLQVLRDDDDEPPPADG